jgi:putative ABC transport system permease protein
MDSLRLRKILRDLLSNPTRTILVVLSIAIGVFAVGMIAASNETLTSSVTAAYRASSPFDATIYADPFDGELLRAVRAMPEVRAAEGRRVVGGRLKLESGGWRNIQMVAIADYDNIHVNKLRPVSGAWPPPVGELLLERASLEHVNAHVGDTIIVETPDRRLRRFRIAGLVHDLNEFPTFWSNTVNAYIALPTLDRLGIPRTFDQLHLAVATGEQDKAHIQQVARLVGDKIENSGRTVYWTYVPEPDRHWSSDNLQAMEMLLTVLGALALLLSGFLVVNTISALLAQHVRQIGIMKAIGASAGQIVTMYLGTVLVFSLLALLVAVPAGNLGGYAFAEYTAGMINIDVGPFQVLPGVVGLQLAAGLGVPLLAALYPVLAGTRITVREALGGHGLGKGRFGQGRVDRLLERVRGLSRPLMLSLRNTFRRKGRLALTLTTLTLAGAIFIGVMSVRDSLLLTLSDSFRYWNYNVVVNFSRPYRSAAIEREALRVPGVVQAESWAFYSARRQRPDDSESGNLLVVGLPAATPMLLPVVLEGRWLLPADQGALVINTDLLRDEPGIAVGDDIVLKIDEHEIRWRVVGLVRGSLSGPIAYANYPYITHVAGGAGRAGRVQIVTERSDAAFELAMARAIEQHFNQIGMRVASTDTTTASRARGEAQFNIIVLFLMIMAVLLAVVGAIGLMGTMSINVLERIREIGVMRAIGAANGAIAQVVIGEGLAIGALSWATGALLAIPLSVLLSSAVGQSFLRAPLSYTFSAGGALLWLALVLLLAGLASLLPAWRATRVSVRDVLTYE